MRFLYYHVRSFARERQDDYASALSDLKTAYNMQDTSDFEKTQVRLSL
jgi:hypothetical protein